MLSYDEDDPDTIISCSFEGINVSDLDSHDIFKQESKWADRELLYETVKAYSALTGWKPTLYSPTCIKCSCFSRIKRKNHSSREYNNGSLSKDCKWHIRIKSTHNSCREILSGSSKGKYKSFPKFDNATPVIISSAKCEHTGTCNPSTQQQIIQRARSGEYIKCISDVALFTLCTIYKEKMSLKSYYVKSILQSQFPSNHNVTKYHVFNMKKRIKMMMPMLENVSTFQDFQRIFKTTKLDRGLDDSPLTDDNIEELGRDIWDELLNNSESEHCFFTFAEYMQSLQDSNSGFDYQLLADSNGRYTGCIWQTSTMKDNFDRFGGFVSIDAMKRGINKLLWPYMSITMYNEINCVCVACEAIICSEREDAYNAMIQFVIKNSKKRTNETIHVVAADGFINQDCVTNKFGLPHATYMCDTWHLFDSILPKRFGIVTFGLIKSYLQLMCYSKTEVQFEEAFNKAMNILQQKADRDENLEEQLRKFYNERSMYASHILSKKRGTRGCHGSSISESNHSSVLVHLNEGDKYGNSYCEKPHTLVKDLFFRQKKHINHWNSVLYNESIQLDVLRGKINIENEPSLYEACSTLCLHTFNKFKKRLFDARDYTKQVLSINCVAIKSLKHPSAPARMCHRKSPSEPFTCKTCEVTIAHEQQCVHSIVANDMLYIKEQFDKRHYRRDRISSEYASTNQTDHNNERDYIKKNQRETDNLEMEQEEFITLNDSNDTFDDHDSDENSTFDDDIDFEADNNCNKSEKQASYYEQECYQHGTTKPMNVLDLRKTFNEILSTYESCTEKMQLVVNSIALSLNEITLTDGKQRGIFRHMDPADIDEEYASNQIVNIIKKHNNSFLPMKGAFQMTSNDVINQNKLIMDGTQTQMRKQKRMRITSNKEKYTKKNAKGHPQCFKIGKALNEGFDPLCIINKKMISSCGFCGSNKSGENISNCEKRIKYRKEYTEYIISKTDNGNKHLICHLQNNVLLSSKKYPDNIVSLSAASNRGKHIIIFNVWLKQHVQRMNNSLSNLLFEISYIDKQGEIETTRRTVCGDEFESIIHVMKYRSKRSFIYDATLRENITNVQKTSLTQKDSGYNAGTNLNEYSMAVTQNRDLTMYNHMNYFSI